MKKIHEGCLAMYISDKPDSPNTGIIVRVGKPIGITEEYAGVDFLWEVDKQISYRVVKTGEIVYYTFAPEPCLFPIDEDDKTTQTQDNELETTV